MDESRGTDKWCLCEYDWAEVMLTAREHWAGVTGLRLEPS